MLNTLKMCTKTFSLGIVAFRIFRFWNVSKSTFWELLSYKMSRMITLILQCVWLYPENWFFCTRMHIQSYFCCLCHTQPNFRVFSKRMRIVLKYTRRAFGYDRRPLKYKRVAPPIFCNVFDITEWHACHIEMLNWVYKPLRIIFSTVT